MTGSRVDPDQGAGSVAGGAARLGLGSAVGTVIAAGTTVLVASRLSPADWGNVATSVSWALGVSTLVLFGLPQLATREVAAGRLTGRDTWGAATTAALFAAPMVFLLLTVVGVPETLAALAALLGLVLALRSGTTAPLVAAGRFRWLGAAATVERLITLAVAVAVLLVGDPLHALLAGQCVGTGFVVVRQARGVVRPTALRPWGVSRLVRLLGANYSFGVSATLFAVAQMDIVLVHLLAGEEASGFYGIASRLVLPLALVGTAVATVLLPRVATAGALVITRRACWLGVAVLALGVGVGVLVVELALVEVLGEAYAPSVPVCVVFLFSIALVTVNQPLVAVAQGCGLERPTARVLAVHELIHLVVAGVGALTLGALGAAFGYLLGNLVLLGWLGRRLVREGGVTWR